MTIVEPTGSSVARNGPAQLSHVDGTASGRLAAFIGLT
jgi:hypothetical protein